MSLFFGVALHAGTLRHDKAKIYQPDEIYFRVENQPRPYISLRQVAYNIAALM